MSNNLIKDPLFEFMIGLSMDEITSLVSDVIKRNDKRKSLMIKYAQILGNDLSEILLTAITSNDILAVSLCLQCGANINYTDGGYTYIHFCAMDGHLMLLKSFIMKGVDINKINEDDNSALELALYRNHLNCAEMLVEYGADLLITYNNKKINLIELIFEIYEPKYKKLFELAVLKATFIGYSDELFKKIKKQVIMKNFDIIDVFLSKFPTFANCTFPDHTLLVLLIESEQTSLIYKFFKHESIDLNPENMLIPYFHMLCSINDMEIIQYFLEKEPESINKYCKNGRTPIDYVVLNCAYYDDDILIKTIKFLINNSNYDILNHRNNFGFRTIESAIQYASPGVVEFLINSGCEINKEQIDCNKYFPSICNNDVLAYASQMDKSEIIEVFFKYDVPVNMCDGIPTSLLNAIEFDSKNSLEQLMSNKQLIDICNKENIKKKLLNFCINNGTGNKMIIKYFINKEDTEIINFNVDTLIFNQIEKRLEKIFAFYQNKKYEILFVFRDVLIFLKQCATVKSDNFDKKVVNNGIIDLIDKYFEVISSEYYDKLRDFILNNYNKAVYQNEFKNIFSNIEMIVYEEDPQIISTSWKNIVELQTKFLHKRVDIFVNLIRIMDQKLKSITTLLPSEKIQYSVHSQNKGNYIRKLLSQLMYPVQSPHYDKMYKRLEGLNCTMSETSQYILVRDNRTNISVLIFNEGEKKPTKWFKYYTYNIGKEDKCDPLHMFPFVLDKSLLNIKCHETFECDIVNKFGQVHLLYFLGILIHDNKFQLGLFEYFIDATSSLFHRFFKPYSQMSDKMKHTTMSNFPTNFKKKYKMARELIKSF